MELKTPPEPPLQDTRTPSEKMPAYLFVFIMPPPYPEVYPERRGGYAVISLSFCLSVCLSFQAIFSEMADRILTIF
jgi:hypothetical protein